MSDQTIHGPQSLDVLTDPATHASSAEPIAPRPSRATALGVLADQWGIRGILRNVDRAILRHAASVPPAELTPLALAALEQHADAFPAYVTADKLRQMMSEADDWTAASLAARSFAQAVDDEATRARARVGRTVIDVYHGVATSVRRRLDEGRLEEIAPRMKEVMRVAQGRRRVEAHREAVAAERAVKIARRSEQLRRREMAAMARAEKMRKEREEMERAGQGG